MLSPGFAETSALVAVLEKKNFTKAAEQLGLSPARVSELVRKLEERTGVRLVERTTRSVAATAAGERLLDRLRPLLDDYQAAFDALEDFRTAPAGTLRLTVPPPAADFVLAPIVARFGAQYPAICLDVSISRSFVDIVKERFDAGIRPGERIARDMIAVRISDDMPFGVAGSPAYIERRGAPKDPQELTNHACIRFRSGTGVLVPWRFGRNRRMFEVQVDGPLIATEPEIGIRAAIDGAGLVQLPMAYLVAALESGQLVPLLDSWVQPQIDAFCLYYSSRRQMRPPLRALVDFLRETYINARGAGTSYCH
jgi:DNA-binding transcriptional LysR family regulator